MRELDLGFMSQVDQSFVILWLESRLYATGTPADFAGADDIITNLAKEREHGIKIIKHTP